MIQKGKKLLLSCDNNLYVHKGDYYFKNREWQEFYYRYLRIFDTLKIANRVKYEETLPNERVLIDDERIEVIDIPNFSGPIEYSKNFFQIGKKLHNITSGCDAAVVRLPSTIGQRVCKSIIKHKIPFAVEVVYDAEDGWKSASNWVERMLWKKIDRDMRNTCYQADGVSCVTEHYLQRHYYSKKNGSFKSNYSTLSLDKSFYYGMRSYPNKTLTLVNVANQIAYDGRKGFKEVIEAISLLKKEGIRVSAKFVGENYHNGIQHLKEMANSLAVGDQIEFVGYISRENLSDLLDNVDLFVMPTKAEGLPRVIIEAMAKGLPVITTPVSGNPELVTTHFLVDYYDINTLANRIKELSTKAELYEATSRENYTRSLQYEASILQERRDIFYSNLRSLI